MAYVNDEEEVNSTLTQGGGGTLGSGGPAPKKGTSSGSFTNLNDYIRANAGGGTQNMTNTVNNNLQNTLNQGKKEVDATYTRDAGTGLVNEGPIQSMDKLNKLSTPGSSNNIVQSMYGNRNYGSNVLDNALLNGYNPSSQYQTQLSDYIGSKLNQGKPTWNEPQFSLNNPNPDSGKGVIRDKLLELLKPRR